MCFERANIRRMKSAHLRYTRAQSRDVQRVYLFENQFLRGDRSIAIHEALVESRLVAAFYE
jgi:hypothetical protein